MGEEIQHTGIVEAIENDTLRVKIVRLSACSTCFASARCGQTESKTVSLLVRDDNASTYDIGENVIVSMSRGEGIKAVVVAFLLPLLLLMAVFFVSYTITDDVRLQSLSAVITITLYYIFLYFYRQKIDSEFAVKVSKE